MSSMHYAPAHCDHPGCQAFALTGAESCWEHLLNRDEWLASLREGALAGGLAGRGRTRRTGFLRL